MCHRALKSAPMAVVAAAVVVAVVVWVLLRLLRKSISTWSGSSWPTLVSLVVEHLIIIIRPFAARAAFGRAFEGEHGSA